MIGLTYKQVAYTFLRTGAGSKKKRLISVILFTMQQCVNE
jgi:hypothetical protein